MPALKYWDQALGAYVQLLAPGGQAVSYAQVQATAPNANAPAIAPPNGFLWIDTSTSPPPVVPYYPPQTPPVSGLNSFTDASGEVWLSKTGSPWRRARDVATARLHLSGANQNVSSGNTTVLLNAAQFDPIGMFSSPSLFAPVAGRYIISAAVGLSAIPAGTGQIQTTCVINGGLAALGNVSYFGTGTVAWPAATVHDIQKLNAGDVVNLNIYLSSGTATVMADPTRTFLAVHFLDPG